jgi:hypothetical protein
VESGGGLELACFPFQGSPYNPHMRTPAAYPSSFPPRHAAAKLWPHRVRVVIRPKRANRPTDSSQSNASKLSGSVSIGSNIAAALSTIDDSLIKTVRSPRGAKPRSSPSSAAAQAQGGERIPSGQPWGRSSPRLTVMGLTKSGTNITCDPRPTVDGARSRTTPNRAARMPRANGAASSTRPMTNISDGSTSQPCSSTTKVHPNSGRPAMPARPQPTPKMKAEAHAAFIAAKLGSRSSRTTRPRSAWH